MKHIFILLLILNRLISLDFFPDTQNVDENNSFQIDPQNDSNSKKLFIEYDVNLSKGTDLNASLVESLADKLGIEYLNKDINASNPQDLKGYANAIKFKLPTSGNTIASQLKTKVGEFDSKDPSTYSKDTILEKDDNSTEYRVIKTMEDFYDNARSRLANLKTIDCYVTRKLANSYYCPLPSLNNSFFKGGSFKDSKDKAKEDCEELCKEQSSCLSKDMGKDKEVIRTYENHFVEFNKSVEIESDITMMGKFIQLDFNTTYQYDSNISVSSNEYNETIAQNEINNSNYMFKIDVSYFDENYQKYIKFINSKTVFITNLSDIVKIYLDVIRSPRYKIDFYETYYNDGNNTVHDDRLNVKLVKSKLEYVDNKYWFCSATHFTEDASSCDGEIKTVIIGSTSYKVCVTDEAKQREPKYGAYYSESQCVSACKIKAECIPTYRHLTSYDPLNLPPELKDIEIGCVDSPTNTSCTKQVCEELFLEDKIPLVEKSWTNDDDIKITVANGVQQTGLVRPRIDIAGGLSANGDEEERTKTSLREMSELSFANMIETNTFNISKQAIKESSSKKYAYEKFENNDGYSISWILKPNSFDVDNNISYKVYAVIEVDTQYRPMYGNYVTDEGIQSGATDSNIALIDKVFLLKTSSGFKIIKRINSFQGKFKKETCSTNTIDGNSQTLCTNVYSWGPVDAYKTVQNETFLNGGYVAYDINSNAEYFTTQKFSSDKKWENHNIFDSIKQLGLIPGLLFNSQSSSNQGASFRKIYDSEKKTLEQSIISNVKVYGIYSESSMSYLQLLNNLTQQNSFYSTLANHPTKIIQDGAYDNTKVNFWVAGKPNNMSVNIDFLPDSNEEGKRTFVYMLLFDEEQ